MAQIDPHERVFYILEKKGVPMHVSDRKLTPTNPQEAVIVVKEVATLHYKQKPKYPGTHPTRTLNIEGGKFNMRKGGPT